MSQPDESCLEDQWAPSGRRIELHHRGWGASPGMAKCLLASEECAVLWNRGIPGGRHLRNKSWQNGRSIFAL